MATAITRADTVATRFDLFGPAYSEAHGDDEGVRVTEASLPSAQRGAGAAGWWA